MMKLSVLLLLSSCSCQHNSGAGATEYLLGDEIWFDYADIYSTNDHIVVSRFSSNYFFSSLQDMLDSPAKPELIITKIPELLADVDYEHAIVYDRIQLADFTVEDPRTENFDSMFFSPRYMNVPMIPNPHINEFEFGDLVVLGSTSTSLGIAVVCSEPDEYYLLWLPEKFKQELSLFDHIAVNQYADSAVDYSQLSLQDPLDICFDKFLTIDACLTLSQGERVVVYNYPREIVSLVTKEGEVNYSLEDIRDLVPTSSPSIRFIDGMIGASDTALYIGVEEVSRTNARIRMYSFVISNDLQLTYRDEIDIPDLELDDAEYITVSCLADNVVFVLGNTMYVINAL